MLLFEWLRLGLVQPFGEFVERFITSFVDTRDQGVVVLSHLYLLVACALPLWFNEIHQSHPLGPYSGIISVGVGDAMVRPRWIACARVVPSGAERRNRQETHTRKRAPT